MSYRCYGDGTVKQPPDIVIIYNIYVPDDAECKYRGVCADCVAIPTDQWILQPPADVTIRDIRPRPTVEQQAAAIVSPHISVTRANTGEYVISHYTTPGDANTPITETRFVAL